MANAYFNAMQNKREDMSQKRGVRISNWEETPIIMDREFLFDPTLSARAKLLYTFLTAVNDNIHHGGDAYSMEVPEIAAMLDLTTMDIIHSIEELAGKGLVEKAGE